MALPSLLTNYGWANNSFAHIRDFRNTNKELTDAGLMSLLITGFTEYSPSILKLNRSNTIPALTMKFSILVN